MPSSSSSLRSSGGVNSAGNPLDTIIVIGGDGRKKILALSWSYGSNGQGIPAAMLPLYGRLVVIAGVDASGYATGARNLPVGVSADLSASGIASFGGRIVFDSDLQAAQGNVGGQFVFPDNGNEGWVGTDSGPLTIILTAPVLASGGASSNIVGKLVVQYDNAYSGGKAYSDGAPGYNSPQRSPSPFG